MKLEELLDCDAATLKAMSNDELTQHFKQYFPVTRPELAPRPKERKAFDPEARERELKIAQLKLLGIDVSDALKGRRK